MSFQDQPLSQRFSSISTLKIWALLAVTVSIYATAQAGPVKIGNSNDGRDLENLSPLLEGPIVEARTAALNLIDKLNTSGIPHLGKLRPELEKSELFIASSDVPPSISDDHSPDHISGARYVYARTLAEPYAPTRFFPAAQNLSPQQLIKLHIHEALHRALPEGSRTNEAIVAQLVLALCSPQATHDSVRDVASRIIVVKVDPISFKRDLHPSQVAYGIRHFSGVKSGPFNVARAHILQSHLYPFGSDENTFGLGFDFSLIEQKSKLQSGPLTLSFRWKAITARNFDFDFYGSASLNTLSFQEMKNSPYGRDIYEMGISMRRELAHFYIENSIGIRAKSSSRTSIGSVDYDYTFGTIYDPTLHVGYIAGAFHAGAYLNIFLADYFAVNGGSFPHNTGRFRVVALGPELSYRINDAIFKIAGRFLIDSTQDADLSSLGILNTWTGTGGIELSVGYAF